MGNAVSHTVEQPWPKELVTDLLVSANSLLTRMGWIWGFKVQDVSFRHERIGRVRAHIARVELTVEDDDGEIHEMAVEFPTLSVPQIEELRGRDQ